MSSSICGPRVLIFTNVIFPAFCEFKNGIEHLGSRICIRSYSNLLFFRGTLIWCVQWGGRCFTLVYAIAIALSLRPAVALRVLLCVLVNASRLYYSTCEVQVGHSRGSILVLTSHLVSVSQSSFRHTSALFVFNLMRTVIAPSHCSFSYVFPGKSPSISKNPRVLAILGWLGLALATFAFSWFNRLSPGSPFLVACLLASSLIGVSVAAIEFAKCVFLARDFVDSMGSSTGIIETCGGAGSGAL